MKWQIYCEITPQILVYLDDYVPNTSPPSQNESPGSTILVVNVLQNDQLRHDLVSNR